MPLGKPGGLVFYCFRILNKSPFERVSLVRRRFGIINFLLMSMDTKFALQTVLRFVDRREVIEIIKMEVFLLHMRFRK